MDFYFQEGAFQLFRLNTATDSPDMHDSAFIAPIYLLQAQLSQFPDEPHSD